MQEITETILVCRVCGRVFTGPGTVLPCGHRFFGHYAPQQWLDVLKLQQAVFTCYRYCNTQKAAECKLVARYCRMFLEHQSIPN